jgi:transcriptional regulator GlxA family with amidase domain
MRALLLLVVLMPGLASAETGVLTAGFVCTPGVYNTELTAPWDVIQHSVYRDDVNYVRTVLITEDGEPFRSAEGLVIAADHSFDDAPELDILVIPSSEGSMGVDLENERFIEWLRERCEQADWVMTLCDGAFPLAQTGLLDAKVATTFPGDRDAFAEKFPEVDVRYDVRFVVDGKFITSTGGAPSFEPAFWLMERLYGHDHVERSAEGLVYEWDPGKVPHLVVLED